MLVLACRSPLLCPARTCACALPPSSLALPCPNPRAHPHARLHTNHRAAKLMANSKSTFERVRPVAGLFGRPWRVRGLSLYDIRPTIWAMLLTKLDLVDSLTTLTLGFEEDDGGAGTMMGPLTDASTLLTIYTRTSNLASLTCLTITSIECEALFYVQNLTGLRALSLRCTVSDVGPAGGH